jgi:hypothetical protein
LMMPSCQNANFLDPWIHVNLCKALLQFHE